MNRYYDCSVLPKGCDVQFHARQPDDLPAAVQQVGDAWGGTGFVAHASQARVAVWKPGIEEDKARHNRRSAQSDRL